jgi:3-oxoacyl-[acyl-carrier-protein] synthase-3
MGLRIRGTGHAVPKNILTNDMLAQMVDTSDEWIVSRTGIRTRHRATDETVRSLAHDAAAQALAATDIDTKRIGLVLCATVGAEQICPSLACHLQDALALRNDMLAFDINAACSGFIYALITAERLLAPGDCALLVGSEVLSRLTDFTDRRTCVLFGDGAGAAVVEAADLPFFSTTRIQGDDQALAIKKYIEMDGQVVFRFAVEVIIQGIHEVVEHASRTLEEIDLFICHQANERILASAAKRLGVPLERFFMNLSSYGNTSAASIPLALDEAVRAGVLQRGQRIVLAGFGGGLTSGAIYMEY